jgi:hypothetical protein
MASHEIEKGCSNTREQLDCIIMPLGAERGLVIARIGILF